jgi:glucuronate isomerase
MKTFITPDFLLNSEPARVLYHEHACEMPIYDFHCHLDPQEILDNRQFDNLAQAWLEGDHYKWRLLRAHGVAEKYITGAASDEEKFRQYVKIMPTSIGNPIYHWSHLELLRFFDIDELLTPENADAIWEKSKAVLQSEEGRYQCLIKSSRVTALCTTDDPADDLAAHRALAAERKLALQADNLTADSPVVYESFPVKVLPTFRPETALHPEQPNFAAWVKKLAGVVKQPINTLDDLKAALSERALFFKESGCRLADQSLGSPDLTRRDEAEAAKSFKRALAGETLTTAEYDNYQACLLQFLGTMYARLDFTMQLHFGVLRNVNTKMFLAKGADIGCDTVGNPLDARSLTALLDGMAQADLLPRTILYTLIPGDYDKFATAAGCFQTEGCRNKIQLGAAWWYSDTLDGMSQQMKTLANTGLLAGFVGMLTDSRSALSYTRHEYFRRLLCDIIGGWAARGMVPTDYKLLGQIIEDICYNNAAEYIGM